MSELQLNRFSSYYLTDEEQLQACILSPLQRMYLQNLLSADAIAKGDISVDTNNVTKFIQEEAYYKGRIELLEYILQLSDATIESTNNSIINKLGD